MKPLEKGEIFQNLSEFLKSRGIELKDGSYSNGIRKSCELLGEAINLGQRGVGRARVEIDKKLDGMRQVIHEKTAPKPPPVKPAAPPAPEPKAEKAKAVPRKKKSAKRSR